MEGSRSRVLIPFLPQGVVILVDVRGKRLLVLKKAISLSHTLHYGNYAYIHTRNSITHTSLLLSLGFDKIIRVDYKLEVKCEGTMLTQHAPLSC